MNDFTIVDKGYTYKKSEPSETYPSDSAFLDQSLNSRPGQRSIKIKYNGELKKI